MAGMLSTQPPCIWPACDMHGEMEIDNRYMENCTGAHTPKIPFQPLPIPENVYPIPTRPLQKILPIPSHPRCLLAHHFHSPSRIRYFIPRSRNDSSSSLISLSLSNNFSTAKPKHRLARALFLLKNRFLALLLPNPN